MFRDQVQKDARNENVPKPRYIPAKRVVIRQDSRPVVRSEVNPHNTSLKSFQGINDNENSHFVRNNSEPEGVRMPRNVYKEERIKEHPVYQGRSVELEPHQPIVRGLPRSQTNMHIQMGRFRKDQQEKLNTEEVPRAHSHMSLGHSLYVRQGKPRNTPAPMAPAREVIEPRQGPSVAQPDNALLWRNQEHWQAPPEMYTPRTTYVDHRLEKRKERQQAYKDRQDAKKANLEKLSMQYIRERHAAAKSMSRLPSTPRLIH